MDFWWILGAKMDPSWSQHANKIGPKTDSKAKPVPELILDRFWTVLGSFFDGFWDNFLKIVGRFWGGF